MTSDLSFFALIRDAGPVVQAVMLILLLASLFSWAVMVQKRSMLNRASARAKQFEEKFWSGAELSSLHRDIHADTGRHSGLERVFAAGYQELERMRKHNMDADVVIAAAHRNMRVSSNRELERLEQHLNFLATVGSTSPYVGLFGTVWGIMSSFHALGSAQQATIAMVAPGISEALVATAMGLFAAIPAVIAYNRFSYQVDRLAVRYDNFSEEFIAILARQLHGQLQGHRQRPA
ncbi:MAG: protein TolQ [Gammaproteobacteria bacterium]|nr:protein TolQ [Gammaproteobacteria bacterium]